MPRYVIHFAQFHTQFRIAELLSLAHLEAVQGFKILHDDPDGEALKSPYLIVEASTDEDAAKLIRRSILAKEIIALWDHADSYEDLHATIQETLARHSSSPTSTSVEPPTAPTHDDTGPPPNPCPYILPPTTSFRYMIRTYNSTRTQSQKVSLVNSFAYLGWKGPIILTDAAEVSVVLLEEWGAKVASHLGSNHGDHPFLHVYMGRLVGGSARHLTTTFDLKKRGYLGTTTMDAELSLIMANLALARPGTLVYDPFVGTGSFLFTCSHFGAYTVGSDIDGRQIRGKTLGRDNASPASTSPEPAPGAASSTPTTNTSKTAPTPKPKQWRRNLIMTPSLAEVLSGMDPRVAELCVDTNARQYGVTGRIVDTLIFDIVRSPWRAGFEEVFDAIVTDPPYGVRAGAKRILGQASASPVPSKSSTAAPAPTTTYPTTEAYDIADVLTDLTRLAARMLVPGGRLVVWVPEMQEQEQDATGAGKGNGEDQGGGMFGETPGASSMTILRTVIASYPLRILHECAQEYTKWRRVLVVVEKVGAVGDVGAGAGGGGSGREEREEGGMGNAGVGQKVGFRERYFR